MDFTKGEKSYSSTFRLKSSSDFKYLREDSKRYRYSTFIVYAKPGRLTLDFSRLGLSVSRKCGNAVFRNLCKRVIREFFRQGLLKSSGHDLLFVVSNRLKSLNKEQLKVLLRRDLNLFLKDLVK